MSSRSFGKLLTQLEPIEEALANYAARACEKMRAQQSRAQGIHVFIETNRFKQEPQYSNGASLGFDHPTADTAAVIRAARQLMNRLYRKGYRYQKCGIMLLDLVPEDHQQQHLFALPDSPRADRMMRLVDGINQAMGPGTIFHATQGTRRDWVMKFDSRSPRYTTQWDELAVVN